MDIEKLKANERRFFDYVNQKEISAMEQWIDEYVADDFVNHSPVLDVTPDKEGLKQMFKNILQFFPDFKIIIKEMVYENEILCFRHITQGLGKNEGIMGLAMVKFKNGKLTERLTFSEPL